MKKIFGKIPFHIRRHQALLFASGQDHIHLRNREGVEHIRKEEEQDNRRFIILLLTLHHGQWPQRHDHLCIYFINL